MLGIIKTLIETKFNTFVCYDKIIQTNIFHIVTKILSIVLLKLTKV